MVKKNCHIPSTEKEATDIFDGKCETCGICHKSNPQPIEEEQKFTEEDFIKPEDFQNTDSSSADLIFPNSCCEYCGAKGMHNVKHECFQPIEKERSQKIKRGAKDFAERFLPVMKELAEEENTFDIGKHDAVKEWSMKPPMFQNTEEDWGEKWASLFDSFCEPNVTKTHDHPNCEYVFSCDEMERFSEKVKSLIKSEKAKSWNEAQERMEHKVKSAHQSLLQKLIIEVEKLPSEKVNSTHHTMVPPTEKIMVNRDAVISLMKEGK